MVSSDFDQLKTVFAYPGYPFGVAIENGRDALASWLEVAREFGDKISSPFSAASGRFVQRVPRSLHVQLVAQAETEGVSLNTLVVSLVAQGLGRRQATRRPLVTHSTRTRARMARAGQLGR